MCWVQENCGRRVNLKERSYNLQAVSLKVDCVKGKSKGRHPVGKMPYTELISCNTNVLQVGSTCRSKRIYLCIFHNCHDTAVSVMIIAHSFL